MPAARNGHHPAEGGYGDTNRKYSDDFGRKQLSDLVEADEELDHFMISHGLRSASNGRKASTSSTYSVSSLDGIWERHPRRLSEAGLRRSSEHSIVLTEDTDSFIIGEHVWVGGSKPGQIAYIGETQFAPGDWAGIVLDEAIGKNDGSVAGIRYFQCAQRRGVFSRLTRLTRFPLTPPTPSPSSPTPTTPGSVTSSARRTVSPARSVRSVASSRMNASISTTIGGSVDKGGELRLGERVIISSSQGSKAGTLRYWGTVEFTSGIWAGVELDDPIGKNDGSVEGKRYFECSPRFGLFAPASKVSRSPSRRRPGACAIHSPAAPRRSTSRESLSSQGTSLATSLASSRLPTSHARLSTQRGPRVTSTPMSAKNTLQELLREKQQHLEQLMKERELERAEVAKYTLQADRAESALSIARKECAKFLTDNEKLKYDLEAVSRQLDDEKQKVDDLLFRAEEDNISKDDYSKYKEKMDNELSLTIQKVSEMDAARALAAAAESAVREQLQRMQLEADTQYQQQTAELQAAQVLSSELQKLLDEAYALLREKENEKDAISKSLNEEINKVKQDTDKHLTESKSKLAVAKTEFDGQVAVLSAKLQAAEAKLTAQTQGLERAKEDSSSALTELMVKLEQTQASLDDKTQELNKVVVASKEQEVFLKKEINKSKMELSSKMIDFETLTENIKKLETNLNSAQEESYSLKDQHGKKISELEGLINDMSQNNETLSLTNKELQHGLQQKQSEMDKVQHDFSVFRELNDRTVEDFKKTIQEKSDEVNVLQRKLNELKSSFENSNESLNNEYKKQIDDKDSTISSLTHQIVELKLSVNQSREDFSNVTANVNTNINEIKKLTEENQQLKHKVLELNEVNTSYTSKISGMELEIGDLKRNLQSITERNEDLLNSKEKLEHDIKSKSTNENEHLNKTIIELQSRDKELAELKDQTRERNNQHERTKQELNQQIQKIQADHLKVVQELSNSLKESCSLMDAENQKMVALRNEFQAVRDEHEKTIVNISVQYEKEKEKLILELDKRKEIESVLNGQLKLLEENSNRLISDLNSSIDELKSSGETSEIKLKEKLDQLVEAQNDLNIKLELARKNEQSLQESLNSSIAKFNEEKSHLESKLKDAENQTVSLGDEITNVKSKLDGASNLLLDKENTIKNLTLQYSLLEVDLKANGDMLIEKDKQIESINDELKKLKDEKHTLEKALKVTEKETNDLHQRLELLTQDNAGNDSLIQDQQCLFEKVQKQLESATTEKHQMEIICNELSQKLELSKQSEESLNKQVKEFQLISLESEGRFKQLEETLKSYKVDSEKLKQNLVLEEKIKEEILKIKSELVDKNMLIANLNIELETSKSSSASSQNELNEKCKKLESESYTFKEKYMKEADTLQKTIREQDKLLKESQPSVDELKVANIKIEELQNLIHKSEEDIKQLNAISSGQKKNYDDISAQLRSDNEKVKKESKKERNALKAQLEEIEKISTTTKTQLDTEIKKRVDLQTRLDESESAAKELQNKVEWLTIHQEKNSSEQQVLLEKLTIELQNSRKKYDEHMKSDANKIDTLNQELLKNMSELDKQKDFANSLQKDMKHYKAKTEIAEREKVLVQKELSKLQITEIKSVKIPVINNNVAVNNVDMEAQKLLEEKQMVEGQVDFLNSVIVDMQRKNEQLLARVHALETGFSAQEADEFNYNGTKSSRVPAPRLFCDICDVWDAHDTEDCPRQAGDEDSGRSSTPPPRDPANKRPPPAPRPYCDVCEVFGHATEDCNEEETF